MLKDTCFILCGGPSVALCLPDPAILPPQKTIVVNTSFKLVPNALHFHFADSFFWDTNKKQIRQIWGWQPTISTAADDSADMWRREGIKQYQKDSDLGLEGQTHKVAGSSSGQQAINIALHYRFAEIVLIGVDCLASAAKTQWHNEHQRQTNVSMYGSHHIPGFESVVPIAEKIGMKIWNVNPASAVKCFEYAPLTKWFPTAPTPTAQEIIDFSGNREIDLKEDPYLAYNRKWT